MFKFGSAFVACVAFVLLGCDEGNAIIGGVSTTVADHPYQVAIDQSVIVDEDNITRPEFICSGALLTEEIVITAASCFSGKLDPSVLQVRVGALFREAGGEAYAVVRYVKNPEFADVMLLFLEAKVPLREEVQTIAIANPNDGLVAGDMVVITGYGDLYDGEQLDVDSKRQLQAVTVPIFNWDQCADLYGYDQYSSRACAGGLNVGTCGTGDVGAPVVNWQGRLVGLGVEHRGPWDQKDKRYCGVPGEPSVFQSVVDSDVWAWIDDLVYEPNTDNPDE